jgi:DHA1 family inner membrane transport protein
MLVLVGIGFSIGNHLGGKFADRSLDRTLLGFLSLLSIMMLLFPLLAQTAIGAAIALTLWGAAAFAVVPPLQMRVMSVAHEASGLASSVNIGAFNLGNALGALAGASVLSFGLNYTAVAWIGALLSGLALLLVGLQKMLLNKQLVQSQIQKIEPQCLEH